MNENSFEKIFNQQIGEKKTTKKSALKCALFFAENYSKNAKVPFVLFLRAYNTESASFK